MAEHLAHLWVGIDAGKAHHWLAVVDEVGATVWSKKVPNDESAILTALGEILALSDHVDWAVDIAGTASALLLALLAAQSQQAVYVPGRTVNRMSGSYRGEAKTDARDAYVIADTARLRRDFTSIKVPAQLAADLALLTAHRTDLIADRVRMLNRLRDMLTGVFPAWNEPSTTPTTKARSSCSPATRPRQRYAATAEPASPPGSGYATSATLTRSPPPPCRPPELSTPHCRAKRSPPASSRTSPHRSSSWTTGSSTSTSRSGERSAPIPRPTSSSPCRAWAPSWELSSSSPPVTWAPTPMQVTSPPPPASCPFHATPDAAPATSTAPSATADASAGSSISPPRPASSAKAPTATTT